MKEKIEYLINLIHKDEIENGYYYTFGFQKEYHNVKNINYGYIPFLLKNVQIEEKILPDIYKTNRNCEKRESTEYICIHDTANGSITANAKMHHRYLYNMAVDPNNTNTVSWHYTVDETGAYQNLPLDEVGHHAGDGITEKLVFIKTNVKATNEEPIFDISQDGYYLINNQKTTILCPLDNEGNIPLKDKLPEHGISYRIDDDGYYLLGNTWWSNFYKRIGNHGGNLNSIGLETCVNTGGDYTMVMRNTAWIVAKLLIEYNLDITRVKQHNYFSGKDCPMSMRHSNRWEEFLHLVEIEKYYQEYLKNVKFDFISLSPEYLDNYGRIIKYETGKEVKYKIIIVNGNETYEKILSSRIGKRRF